MIAGVTHRLAALGIMLTLTALLTGCARQQTKSATNSDRITCRAAKNAERFATTKLLIEHNATDKDTGVQAGFDAEGWTELCLYDPSGKLIAAVKPQSEMKKLGLAEIFFESREPPNSEVPIADHLAAFPEGEYEVRGLSFDGKGLTGTATFTHAIPTGTVITSPPLTTDEEKAADSPIPTSDVEVTWEDVTQTVEGDPVEIVGYEVIVTNEKAEDPNGFSKPVYDVHLPADRNSLRVPSEFFQADTLYAVEVLAIEKSGNQTISSGFFQTR